MTAPRCWRPGCGRDPTCQITSWWGAIWTCDGLHLVVARAVTGRPAVRTWQGGVEGALFEVEKRRSRTERGR